MNLSLPLPPSPSSLSLLKQSHYLLMTGQSTCSACPGLPAGPQPGSAPPERAAARRRCAPGRFGGNLRSNGF